MSARRRARARARPRRPLCRAACGVAAGCTLSVVHPMRRTHANARRRRVSHRAPALRPHRTDQIRMRVRCAHNREGQIFDLFGPPEILGVGPAPGSAVLQLGLVWQAKQAVAAKKAAEEAEKVRSSRALDAFGLRRTASDACSCAEWQQCYYSDMSALCRTRAMRWRVRVRTAGGREAACACAWL